MHADDDRMEENAKHEETHKKQRSFHVSENSVFKVEDDCLMTGSQMLAVTRLGSPANSDSFQRPSCSTLYTVNTKYCPPLYASDFSFGNHYV